MKRKPLKSPGHQVHVSYHRWMLQDETRTEALRRMVQALVKPGDVVADVGTGTGILAVWAKEAGARRVFGIDASSIVHLARRMVSDNGVDGVEMLIGDAADIDLPEPVDVVFSECLGNFAFGDAMFEALRLFSERWLKEGGRRGPTEVKLFLQPADGRLFHDPLPFWHRPWEGLDLSAFAQAENNRMVVVESVPSFLWNEAKEVVSFDPYARDESYSLSASWPIPEGRMVTAVVGWFDVAWAPGVWMSTSPSAPDTHWSQALFPLSQRIAGPGERLDFDLEVGFLEDEIPLYRWTARWMDDAGKVLFEECRDMTALFTAEA